MRDLKIGVWTTTKVAGFKCTKDRHRGMEIYLIYPPI